MGGLTRHRAGFLLTVTCENMANSSNLGIVHRNFLKGSDSFQGIGPITSTVLLADPPKMSKCELRFL